MNTSRLKLLLATILNADAGSGASERLKELVSASQAWAANPNSQNRALLDKMRRAFSESADALAEALNTGIGREAVNTLGVLPYTSNIFVEVEYAFSQFNSAPGNLQSRLSQIEQERRHSLGRLITVDSELNRLGIEPEGAAPGRADLGFLLPRTLFDNSLHDFSRRLKELDQIIDAFSLAYSGKPERAKLETINTSNPLLFLQIDHETVRHVVHGFKFALNIVGEFQAAKKGMDFLRGYLDKGAAESAEAKLQADIDKRVSTEIERRLKEFEKKAAEDAEDRERLKLAYRHLIRHAEKGLQIKVRVGLNENVDEQLATKLIEIETEAKTLPYVTPIEGGTSLLTDGRETLNSDGYD